MTNQARTYFIHANGAVHAYSDKSDALRDVSGFLPNANVAYLAKMLWATPYVSLSIDGVRFYSEPDNEDICDYCGTKYERYDRSPFADIVSMAVNTADDLICLPCMISAYEDNQN